MPRCRIPGIARAAARRVALVTGACLASVLATACASTTGPAPSHPVPHRTAAVGRAASVHYRWNHVVVVVEENHSASQVLGSGDAPYLAHLAATGISFTGFHAETHPSEPNYLALFSGSTHGLNNERCPVSFDSGNLGTQLRSHGLTFAGYSEGLPSTGWGGCESGAYARKHNPWSDFRNLPASVDKPFTAFPARPAQLPRLSFVIPDLQHDMHDGSVAAGDAWLRSNLGDYARWARTHHSLLVITWDEDDGSTSNHVATIAVGQGLPAARVDTRFTHYSLLRTLEDVFALPHIGHARTARTMRLLAG